MNLFLHIKLLKNQFEFTPPFEMSDAQYFDVDNFSSPEVITIAQRALLEANKLVIFFDLTPGCEHGQLLKLITKISTLDKPNMKAFSGEHAMLKPLLKKIGATETQQKVLLKNTYDFFKEA